jgi:hypothetical protein
MRRPYGLLGVLALWSATGAADPQASHPREIAVSSYLVHVGDILGSLDPSAAELELGPAPAASGSRVIDREDIVRAFREHEVEPPRFIPAAVRIVRKMRRVDAPEVAEIVRDGLTESLPKGASITNVHAARISVPDGWTRTACTVPRPPHRAGGLTSQASLTFYENDQATWRVVVPVDLALSQEATVYDVTRGSRVTLVIRRGFVEVSAVGTAGADADVGDLVPVILLPSGRTLAARLEDKDHAVAQGAP